MSHIVSRQPWGVIDLDTREGRIFFQQDWHYNWLLRPPLADWTIQEKRYFHNTLDRQVWGRWSMRIRFPVRLTPGVASPSATARELIARVGARGVPINFDVHWVLGPGHWQVNVTKIAHGDSVRSNVNFTTRIINLDTEDFIPHDVETDGGVAGHNFLTAPHEYGHTLDNPDEYTNDSPNLADTSSTMNIGNQIRPRHLHLIVDTLNTMLPGVTFSAPVR